MDNNQNQQSQNNNTNQTLYSNNSNQNINNIGMYANYLNKSAYQEKKDYNTLDVIKLVISIFNMIFIFPFVVYFAFFLFFLNGLGSQIKITTSFVLCAIYLLLSVFIFLKNIWNVIKNNNLFKILFFAILFILTIFLINKGMDVLEERSNKINNTTNVVSKNS